MFNKGAFVGKGKRDVIKMHGVTIKKFVTLLLLSTLTTFPSHSILHTLITFTVCGDLNL
jgi:hypothetical protein